MADGSDHRDTENNWVIPNTEGLLVETVGAGNGESPPSHEDVAPEVPEATIAPERADTDASSKQEMKGPEPAPLITEVPPHQEEMEMPPEEPASRTDEQEPQSGLRRRVGAELEEVSCSSSDDDLEGLRKRAGRGSPPASVGAAAREAEQLEADAGSSLILNKCIIATIALVGLAVLVLTGGFGSDDDSPQSIFTRSVTEGDQQPQAIADIQEWIQQHAGQFTGEPSSLQVMSSLLDKVAKENQDIRHMQATLQAQKEELETLLHAEARGTPGTRMTEENVRLKDALLQEETGHLSAKEELQDLQEKIDAMEVDTVEKEALISQNTQLKTELETSKTQMESFLTQKETLVAESQMLRQELDKQRLLVSSIKQDLESLAANKTVAEDDQVLQNRISEMSKRLAMEAQRSESWEKKYVEHAQKRKELVGEEKKVHGHKMWKKGDKWVKAEGQGKKPHLKHGRDHGKSWEEEEQREPQHEEWRSKKQEDKQHWHGKKHRHGEDDKEHHAHQSESWKDKGKDQRWKDSSAPHHEGSEKTWKDKHSHHHHGETGNGFHPRKGQKEFSEAHKHGEEKRREHGDKVHRHHDHNKFWKKLSDHQYRVPEGCSGLEDCARKDGIDLFNVELKPVQRKQFEEVLQNYLAKSELSKNLPDLVPLLDGFFEGSQFAHHKIRFKDFVDDVEDFLEDLARKETGNDDAVDDFERFVYTSFFGDAAHKKRSAKKDDHRRSDKLDRQHNPGKPEETIDLHTNQTYPKYKDKHNWKADQENSNYKPYKGKYTQDRPHNEDRKDTPWKKSNKYDSQARRNQNNNNSHDVDQNGEDWPLDMPKYTERDQKHSEKSHNHGQRSHSEHDRERDDQDFHEHKPYKKPKENQNWQGDHYQKDKYRSEGHGHQDKYTSQKFSHGTNQPEHKYSPSLTELDEDTEQSYHHQHKNQWKKHEKDAVNEHDRASQPHYEGPHHKHKREDGHKYKKNEYYDRSSQHYHSKPHHDQHYDNRHKHHHDEQEEYKPKHHHDYEKQGDYRPKHNHDEQNYKHKHHHDYDQQDDYRLKHHHEEHEDYKPKHHHEYDKQGDYRPKHNHDELNHKHKPHHDYDQQDNYRPKHHHDKQDGSTNKPHYDNRPKNHPDKQDDNRYKHHHDKQGGYKHKPYSNKQDKHHHDQHDDSGDKPYYSKWDDNKHKPHHDKHGEGKHRSYYDKHSHKSYQNDRDEDEELKNEDAENTHGSSYYKQGHHHDHKKY